MRRWVACETKLVAIETEDTVEGDLTAVLQTRNTKTSDLTPKNESKIKYIVRLLARQLFVMGMVGFRMAAFADYERIVSTWAGCAGRSQSVIKPDD
jgi:hypothetical protein